MPGSLLVSSCDKIVKSGMIYCSAKISFLWLKKKMFLIPWLPVKERIPFRSWDGSAVVYEKSGAVLGRLRLVYSRC